MKNLFPALIIFSFLIVPGLFVEAYAVENVGSPVPETNNRPDYVQIENTETVFVTPDLKVRETHNYCQCTCKNGKYVVCGGNLCSGEMSVGNDCKRMPKETDGDADT